MLKKIKEWGKSLNNRLMGIILLCGIVPVIFIVLFVASSYRRGIMEKTESMVENEMEYVSSLISGRLNHAIEICKAAAYDEEYENAWREYQSEMQSGTVPPSLTLAKRKFFSLLVKQKCVIALF